MCIVLCLYLIYIITFLLLKIKRKIEINSKNRDFRQIK